MRLLSIFQVAQLCSIDWQTVRDWIEAGTLPAPILVGGWLRWRETDVEAWIQDGCPPSALRSDVEPLWDALLAELKAADHQAKGN